MKRGGPLKRGTRLRSYSTLARFKPLARQSAAKRAAAANWRRCRETVWERSGGRCEHCGLLLDAAGWQCHHRRFRSQGGLDQPENLVALTPACHRQAHTNRAVFEPLGFVVPSTADPALVPVRVHGRGLVYLDGGSYRRAAA